MQNEMIQIGALLRSAREAKGLTQVALAKETNTAERTIMDIENDKRYPTFEVLYRIVRALNLSADQIFWPDKVHYSQEYDQMLREIQSCDKQAQSVIKKTTWACMRALQQEMIAKKTDSD